MPENPNNQVTEVQAIPDSLNVSLLFEALGKGVQIYVCTAKPDEPGKFEWKFKAPQANLHHDEEVVAIHNAGPTWEALDGSKVIGTVVASTSQKDDIPWLLLRAVENGGVGIFSEVIYIQRLYTTGGKAPDSGCDNSQEDGKEILVPYTAHYLFYGPPAVQS